MCEDYFLRTCGNEKDLCEMGTVFTIKRPKTAMGQWFGEQFGDIAE